jgi:uncharacterized protein (UPF0335 family)
MNTRTAKEDLQYWDTILDEYESSIGLPKYIVQYGVTEQEINQYLSMSRDEIEKISPEDCAQISYRLAQFAFHVQRTVNREIARLNWADETIKEAIADEINNYKGYGFVEKSLQAIKHNDKASALNNIKKYAKQRIDRLSYISNGIKNLSDIMMSIQKTKVQYGTK